MAIAFARALIISRTQSYSAVNQAAYRSGQSLYDERNQELITKYEHRRGIAHSEIILPHGADPKYADREYLWNRLEEREDQHSHRATAQLAKDIVIALPRELSDDQHIEMARKFAMQEFVQNGIPVDINIHYDRNQNPHAHIMVPFRRLTDEGFGNKARDLNPIFTVNGIVVKGDEAWGEKWRGFQNNYFEKNDIPIFIERGAEGLFPQIHHGKAAHAIYKETGNLSDIMRYNEEMKAKTAERILEDPSFALEKITGKKTLFSKQDISRYIFKFFPDQEDFKSVMDRLMADKENLVRLDNVVGDGRDVPEGYEQIYTTKDLLQSEVNIAKRAENMENDTVPKAFRISENDYKEVIKKYNKMLKESYNSKLNRDQDRGIRTLLMPQRMVGIIGPAGTGKTTLIEVANEVWKNKGYETYGLALAGKAAEGLEGTGLISQTIASFEHKMKLGDAAKYSLENFMDTEGTRDYMLKKLEYSRFRLTSSEDGTHPKWIDKLTRSVESGNYTSRGLRWREAQLNKLVEAAHIKPESVFVVDEAGMVGTRQFERIQERIDVAGAKMVVLFDNCQAPAIEAGAPTRIIEETIKCHKLETVIRQKARWQRKALAEIRDGDFRKGYDAFKKKGFVHFEETQEDANRKLTNLMFEHYWKDPLADRVAGAFTNKAVDKINDDIRASLQERGRLLDGVDLTVIRDDMSAYEEYGGVPIPKPAVRNFAPGDRIVFLKNNRELGIKNGTLARIDFVSDKHILVTTKGDNKKVAFSPKEYNRFDHGYALTVHKLQGDTVKGEKHLMGTRSWVTGRQLTYVGMSRHTDNVHLYGSREEFKSEDKFIEALSKDTGKSLAMDHYKGPAIWPRLYTLRSEYSQEFQAIQLVKQDGFALRAQDISREGRLNALSMMQSIEQGESMSSLGKPKALFDDLSPGQSRNLRASYDYANLASNQARRESLGRAAIEREEQIRRSRQRGIDRGFGPDMD